MHYSVIIFEWPSMLQICAGIAFNNNCKSFICIVSLLLDMGDITNLHNRLLSRYLVLILRIVIVIYLENLDLQPQLVIGGGFS